MRAGVGCGVAVGGVLDGDNVVGVIVFPVAAAIAAFVSAQKSTRN